MNLDRNRATSFDVLAFGCHAIDEILFVEKMPSAGEKEPVVKRIRSFGGLAGNALVAASKLGARCAFAGYLGSDRDGEEIAQNLGREGICVDYAVRSETAGCVRSTVIVEQSSGQRSILFCINGLIGASPDSPDESLLRQAKLFLIDNYGREGIERILKFARSNNIPVVADFEPTDPHELTGIVDEVDHLVLSESAALLVSGAKDATTAVARLWNPGRKAVVITAGEKGCWWMAGDCPREVHHLPAFAIEAQETSGCGDVFHGVYAYALARKFEVEDSLKLASAAAALKATRKGGQSHFPDSDDLAGFLSSMQEARLGALWLSNDLSVR